MNLPILVIFYKWDHIICGLLWLAFFTSNHVFKDHPSCTYSNTWLLFITGYYPVEWLYPILFIHALGDGHLGCYYILAIMNNVSINTSVQIFQPIYVFSSPGDIRRHGTAGPYIGSMFMSSCPSAIVEKAILSLWNYFSTLVKDQLTINVKMCFWNLSSIPLIYMSVCTAVPPGLATW